VAKSRLVTLLVLVGLMIPLTMLKGEQARYRPNGAPARTQLQTSPGTGPIQNLLLVTIDALRADHLGAYGYERPTSPVIDSLAAESVLFEHCFSQGNRTELSMGSMFTSLYPSMHSVRRVKYMANALPDEIETLAESLRDAGLRTVGLMDNPYLKREWGLTQGFDLVKEFHYGYLGLLPVRCLLRLGLLSSPNRVPLAPVPRADLVIDEAIRQLRHLKDRPFYLYVHLMDVHHPYIPPKPYEASFQTPGASSTQAKSFWMSHWAVFNMLPSEEELLPRADLLRVTDLYDAAIRYVDAQIGRLLKQMDLLGLSENTLVILTSDHGDEFLEHGDILHKNQFLYDELIHVPLIIRTPGNEKPRRVEEIVRHIDFLPTVQEIFGLPIGGDVQGQSLKPLLFGSPGWVEVPAFSQSYEFAAVRTQTHKLMYNLPNGKSHCFDLLVDPAEMNNVYGEAAACESLESALMKFLLKVIIPHDRDNLQEIDERTREQLRSLGYM
ncbi:MAG: sulfatase, partial [Candidatus Eisenbacteria sp.]|nr:sulfatase [Candidatus Eisenbacteria bacterium]